MIGIIFDCDGVLVDSESCHFLSWQKALQKRGISWEKENHYPLCGYPGTWIAQKLCEQFKIRFPEALLADKRNFFQAFQEKGFPAMPFAIKLLRQLHSKRSSLRIKLAIASSANKKDILQKLQQHGLCHIFDVIVSGYDDLAEYRDVKGTNKPKPYIYLHTVKLLELKPTQCIAIEDSGPGISAASSAGIITFAIPNEFTQNHDFSMATYSLAPNKEINLEAFYQQIIAEITARDKETLHA